MEIWKHGSEIFLAALTAVIMLLRALVKPILTLFDEVKTLKRDFRDHEKLPLDLAHGGLGEVKENVAWIRGYLDREYRPGSPGGKDSE